MTGPKLILPRALEVDPPTGEQIAAPRLVLQYDGGTPSDEDIVEGRVKACTYAELEAAVRRLQKRSTPG